jgi:hypothetical protein
MDKLASFGITCKRIPQWMMPIGAHTPSRFDIAMLHKRDVDVINGVIPAAGTSLTAIEVGFRSEYDPEA